MAVWTKCLRIAYALLPMSTSAKLLNLLLFNHFSSDFVFDHLINQFLNHVNDLVKYCKDHCIKNIIIGGKVSDPGRLGYLTCNRIQIYPPPSAIQDTMVAISASSRTATSKSFFSMFFHPLVQWFSILRHT